MPLIEENSHLLKEWDFDKNINYKDNRFKNKRNVFNCGYSTYHISLLKLVE